MRLKSLHKCEDGTQRALRERTREAALQVFYGECADLFVELPCRNALVHASRLHEADQLPAIIDGCREAYCPIGKDVEACRPNFVLDRARAPIVWHELSSVILTYEAGAYLPQVQEVLYWWSLGVAKMPDTPAPAPPPSGG